MVEKKEKVGVPKSLLDGVDFDSFVHVFTSDENKVLEFKEDDESKGYLNTVTKEPYVGCGLTGDNLIDEVLPPLYYNAKIDPPKPVLLVGASGTGKTSIGKCFVRNFANARLKTILSGNKKEILREKQAPILRIQHYANIMNEDIVGDWDYIRMLHAGKDEDITDKDKFFRLGPLTRALYDQKDKDYQGRGILLDEITRAYEETMNVELEPLRERIITVTGECFGECQHDIKKPRFYAIATANEGDAGTIDLPSAMQTRFSRQPVGFISADNEQILIEKELKKLTEDESQIKMISSSVPCLTRIFRGIGKDSVSLVVKPSIKDGTDLAKIYVEKGATQRTMKDPVFKRELADVVVSVLGKNAEDASKVREWLQTSGTTCNLSLT